MPIVDIHVHVYPQKIALKAAQSVGAFYGVDMPGDGSVDGYFAMTEGSPITHQVVHSVAVKPSNVESINNFIAGACEENPSFIGFMTLHQDYEDPAKEIDRALAMGLKGIKIHPDMQGVAVDDPRFMKVFEIAEAKGVPMIVHCGDYREDLSHPRRIKHILQTFPKLMMDAAHFGGWSIPDLALEFLENENCFVDVSSALTYIGPRRTRELVRAYGCDRILFGSDYPMWNPVSELQIFLDSLAGGDFTQAEVEQMTWHNAEKFLQMDIR
ncbi:MAG: amidohydrolase [Coriobacteriales bacterium]|nr:amidohydrolase [Coriobacteriales bacterium]